MEAEDGVWTGVCVMANHRYPVTDTALVRIASHTPGRLGRVGLIVAIRLPTPCDRELQPESPYLHVVAITVRHSYLEPGAREYSRVGLGYNAADTRPSPSTTTPAGVQPC